MAVIKINGVDASAIMSVGASPKGARRDIGETAAAASGGLRVTRQSRKRDFSFETIPLSGEDSHAWESLILGEGHVWSFDTSLYSSKGLGPSAVGSGAISSELYAFGGKSLRIDHAAANTVYSGVYPYKATVAFRYMVSTWLGFVHYVIRTDGAKWVDGVRNDAASTPFLTLANGVLTFVGDAAEKRFWDDVVVFHCLVPTGWPVQLYGASSAYPGTPYLSVTGDLVREKTGRRMLGMTNEASVLMGGKDGSFHRDLRRLSVELQEA